MGRPIIDITGQKIGDLIVLNRVPNGVRKNGREYTKWLCKCSCGNIKEFDGTDLLKSKRRITLKGRVSCGCKRRKLEGESSLLEVYNNYKRKAKERNYEFNITLEEFKNITQKKCHYCGEPPSNECDRGYSTGSFIYNGIDRVDNIKGYYIDNIVPCCKICNIAKRNMTVDEFLNWIQKVYKYSITHVFL